MPGSGWGETESSGLAAGEAGYHRVVPSSSTRPEKRLDEKRRRRERAAALRGRVLHVPELAMPVVVTYHPSAVLRAGEERERRRAELADDLELARASARPVRRGVETASRG